MNYNIDNKGGNNQSSHPLRDIYPESTPDESQTPVPQHLLHDLDERGSLAYGKRADGTYSKRDKDRARILRFLAQHPEGTLHSHITSYVLKGLHPEKATWTTTEDSDHRFVNRFLRRLEDERPNLVENRKTAGSWHVSPTLALIDLIRQGITQTRKEQEWIYDRDFAKQILSSRGTLTDKNREHLESSFRRYVNRIENYRLLFDVYVDNGRSEEKRRMEKGYATRFNSEGRVKKQIARFNQALERAYAHADTACLVTLTSDPGTTDDDSRPDPRSLMELTENINLAFNRLNQFLKTDPSTKENTRRAYVPQYRTELKSEVTGRPRERLEYIKVLEFSESGLPHLHVLYFDPPTRDKDGGPWLIDKQELSDKWQDYGQGQIVDIYPLTKRDDLCLDGLKDLVPSADSDLDDKISATVDDLVTDTVSEFYRSEHLDGQHFNVLEGDSGFVDWYRFGDNSLEQTEIEAISRSHQIDMAGYDEILEHKTAGAYLGKYLSATFGELLNVSSKSSDSYETHEKTETWKLALYWATNRRFWSISRGIQNAIDRDESLDDQEKRVVRWCTKDTITRLADGVDHAEHLPDLDSDTAQSVISRTVSSPHIRFDFLGAYHYNDIPDIENTSTNITDVVPWNERESGVSLSSRGDRPPPAKDVWS
jgi:hypothetical protein